MRLQAAARIDKQHDEPRIGGYKWAIPAEHGEHNYRHFGHEKVSHARKQARGK
jgi:hypothetical protein